MTKIQQVSAAATTTAPPSAVFARLADTESWPKWAAFDEATLEQPGVATPQGTGAIRRFRRGRKTSRERVVGYDPPHHFAYTLLEGLPLDDYRSDVMITSEGGVTTITWTSTFRVRAPRPAWPFRVLLGRFIADTVRRLARVSEADGDSPPST